MLTLGHISASYLLAQTSLLLGTPLSNQEQIFVMAAGYVLDLDLLFARIFVKREAYHHLLPTHTPLFAVTISILGYLLFRNIFSNQAILLAVCALFLHLVLDDIGYWFYKLGWQRISTIPQIFWLYPFDKRRKHFVNSWQNSTTQTNAETLELYLTKAPVNVILEVILGLAALTIVLTR